MEIRDNEINDMLQEIGIETPNSSPSSEETSESFSEEDISDILEENGFSSQPSEEEESENSSYNENQGEGEDWEAETQSLEEEEEESSETESVEEETSQSNSDEEENTDTQDIVKIPLNSPTLLIDDSTSRFSGAEWFNEIQKQRIIIAGLGGIGGNLAFQIARMTPENMVLYDDDTVEIVNMAGQLYSRTDVGKFKVDAIADMIQSYTSMSHIVALREKFTWLTEPGDIMMCGFDNMKAREAFFNSWLGHIQGYTIKERKKCLFLDGRLSMTTLQILCIRGDDTYNIDRYNKEFLFSDSEAEETVCSMKQTTYLACMIGSLMTNLFTNFVASSLDPIIPYDLPFFTEYDAQTMIFKTEN